uniref:Uncharacterized protein n=1 Tax=Takifugu rubripes TaxID=31033 RepID=A0A674MC60_TAKRU
ITLDSVGQLKGHSGPLAGVVFSHSSPDLLYSASADGTVRCWDVRRPAIQRAPAPAVALASPTTEQQTVVM